MAGMTGFEPIAMGSQSPLPYPKTSQTRMVEKGGFEPPNSERIDLQSTAFSHFATSPEMECQTIGLEPTTYSTNQLLYRLS